MSFRRRLNDSHGQAEIPRSRRRSMCRRTGASRLRCLTAGHGLPQNGRRRHPHHASGVSAGCSSATPSTRGSTSSWRSRYGRWPHDEPDARPRRGRRRKKNLKVGVGLMCATAAPARSCSSASSDGADRRHRRHARLSHGHGRRQGAAEARRITELMWQIQHFHSSCGSAAECSATSTFTRSTNAAG